MNFVFDVLWFNVCSTEVELLMFHWGSSDLVMWFTSRSTYIVVSCTLGKSIACGIALRGVF